MGLWQLRNVLLNCRYHSELVLVHLDRMNSISDQMVLVGQLHKGAINSDIGLFKEFVRMYYLIWRRLSIACT